MKRKSIVLICYLLVLSVMIIAPAFSCAIETQEKNEDEDGDGLPDDWELMYFGNITFYGPSDDPDGDSLTNLEEYQEGTDPTNSDTDGDNMPESWELQYDLDPNDAGDAEEDADNDGYTNLDEYKHMTNPQDRHSPEPSSKEDADGADGEALDATVLPILLFGVPGVVILLGVMFLYTKMRREQLLEHRVRANIYDYINKNPGVHYRGIMNDLDLQMGVLTHHLNMLEQERYIKSYQDGMYRRFYPISAQIDTGLILTDVQRRILKLIQGTPGISQADISRNLGYTRKVVYYHVKILENAGFVHVEPAGRESQCYYLDGLDQGQQGPQSSQAAG
ncbi:winged helix-turn-helix transcriptional regulator [[Eubacterium] cellulosolvens]